MTTTREDSSHYKTAPKITTCEVVMYRTATRLFCWMADRLEGEAVAAVNVARDDVEPERCREMIWRAWRHIVPQISTARFYVGGFDDLMSLDRAERFDPLLQGGQV